jgi:tetratricopeptide (TPR) repeat protein
LAYAYQFIDKEKALHWSSEAIRRDPESELAWRVRIVISYDRQDWDSFKRILSEMQRMFPEEGYLYRLNAQYLLTLNKTAEAVNLLRQAISLQHSAVNYAVYSYALALSGDHEASRDAESTALREAPENVQVLLYTGWAADRRGDYKQAAERMNAAVRLDPNNKQTQEEYLETLQKSYWFYRVLLLPNLLKKLKPWQLLLLWVVSWILFRPLLIVFIVLYIASYWISKWLVHVKVFGFRRAPRSRKDQD